MIGKEEIWVILEQCNGELTELSLEVLGEGRRVANESNRQLGVLVLGERIRESGDTENGLLESLAYYGADNIYLFEHPLLGNYISEVYTSFLAELVCIYYPYAVIFGATANGRDLASSLASRLNTGIAQDCLLLKPCGEVIEMTKPVFEGKVYKTVVSRYRPHVAVIPKGVIGIDEPNKSRRAKNIVKIQPNIHYDILKTKRVKYLKADPRTIDIRDSEIIVAGGRGVGSKENWKLIEELAGVLGGSVAGSRMAMDNGWINRDRLVGQTGKIVNAKVYIGCGISGAINHIVGMKKSKLIIAINTDRQAPIMKLAHIGIIGDLKKAIPALIDQLQK